MDHTVYVGLHIKPPHSNEVLPHVISLAIRVSLSKIELERSKQALLFEQTAYTIGSYSQTR